MASVIAHSNQVAPSDAVSGGNTNPVAMVAEALIRDSFARQGMLASLGAEIAETASVEEWKEQKQQFECPLEDMVAEVRKILEK